MIDTKTYADACLERAEKATPGPWKTDPDCSVYSKTEMWDSIDQPSISAMIVGRTVFDTHYGTRQLNDCDFIAHARTDVPELAKMVIQLETENIVLRGKVKKACEALRHADQDHYDDIKHFEKIADELESMPVEE